MALPTGFPPGTLTLQVEHVPPYRNEYPTVPGWYWMTYPGNPGYDYIVHWAEFTVNEVKREGEKPAKGVFYAGPITPPARPDVATVATSHP